MSKTKRIRYSADSIAITMQRERMLATVEYNTVKSNPSSMYYPSAHVIEYRSFFLMSVSFSWRYSEYDFCLFVVNKEHKNGSLNVVDVAVFS